MLVLTRKLDETIRIGDQITVTVLQVKGRTVKIGISAPRDVRVMRAELDDRPAAAGPLELTLDAGQLGTADGLVCESFATVELEAEVEAESRAPQAARGLGDFRRSRSAAARSARPAPAGLLAAATAN